MDGIKSSLGCSIYTLYDFYNQSTTPTVQLHPQRETNSPVVQQSLAPPPPTHLDRHWFRGGFDGAAYRGRLEASLVLRNLLAADLNDPLTAMNHDLMQYNSTKFISAGYIALITPRVVGRIEQDEPEEIYQEIEPTNNDHHQPALADEDKTSNGQQLYQDLQNAIDYLHNASSRYRRMFFL